MASLSLNTSITSSHKTDFYSEIFTDTNNTPWVVIYNLYGNYFTEVGYSVPCEDMIMYGRTYTTQHWKEIGRANMCGYYGYCYFHFNWIYGFYSNLGDPDHFEFFDKLRVNYDGMSVESFINRTNLNTHTLDVNNDNINNALLTITCYSICDYYPWSKFIWTNKTTTSDNNGNATTTFFNPPGGCYYPDMNRVYKINATKNTLSGYKIETIPHQQYYPSEQSSVNVQLICSEQPQCNLTISD